MNKIYHQIYLPVILLAVLFMTCNLPFLNNPKDPNNTDASAKYAPKNLTATDGESLTEVILKWDKSTYAEKYMIYRSASIVSDFKEVGQTSSNNYSDNNLPMSDVNYYYKVKAILDTKIETDFSNVDIGYIVQVLQVKTPAFSIPEGTYFTAQSVTMSTATTGAAIKYTTNGSDPSPTNGTIYNGTAVVISATITIKAFAYKSGWVDSNIALAVYTITCAPPTFSPPAGSYITAQNITISTTTNGATIRYTTDGINPPTSSFGTIYSSPINISSAKTLMAIAYKSGLDDSSVTSAAYIIISEMIAVPGGTFNNGTADMTVSGFYVGKYEVTYEQWYTVRQWALLNGYTFANVGREGSSGGGTFPTGAKLEPVTTVNWRDVIVWCNALSEYDGKTPCYTYSSFIIKNATDANDLTCDNAVCTWINNGYRLPTETEWEYTARYQNGSIWTPADYLSGATANYTNDAESFAVGVFHSYNTSGLTGVTKTANVGTKNPNQLGIYDMSGNVWEWCWDWYGGYPGTTQADYKGPTSGSKRIVRGGSWLDQDGACTVSNRMNSNSFWENFHIGFRLARSN